MTSRLCVRTIIEVKVAEWPSFGKELSTRLAARSLYNLFICNLVISYFGFEEGYWF